MSPVRKGLSQSIEMARRAIDDADGIVVSAGAGMGVDSGLPDFRGNRGFWKAYPVAEKLGLSFVDLANPSHFLDNPRLAWAFYGHRLNLYRGTKPHNGFRQLLKWSRSKPQGYFVYTSNVDGQFQAAGFDENRIVECHGSIHRLQCSCCGREQAWSANGYQVQVDMTAFLASEPLPTCDHCGAIARPNILMFGDSSWVPNVTDTQMRGFREWWEGIVEKRQKVAVVEIGAGMVVPTVRLLSQRLAEYSGVSLIRINPADAEVPPGHFSIPLSAADALQRILD